LSVRSNSSSRAAATAADETVQDDDDYEAPAHPTGVGLYHAFADAAWNQLTATGWFDDDDDNDTDIHQERWAPAKGMPAGSFVKMTVRARRATARPSPVAYARYALLETLVPCNDSEAEISASTHVQGIQVLNFVVIPAVDSSLPVWGADFVALPGGKHLLLLDAQPMVANDTAHTAFGDWYQDYQVGGATDDDNDSSGKTWPWAGDLPPAVAKYVSPKALWTRLALPTTYNKETADDDDNSPSAVLPPLPTDQIQKDLLPAMEAHLAVYLKLLADAAGNEESDNWLPAYLEYRRANDPARPMLQSLYGKEWTEEILETVLFPVEELLGAQRQE
jgi:phycoerythrobilin:ferredoxin oxidoreductase